MFWRDAVLIASSHFEEIARGLAYFDSVDHFPLHFCSNSGK